MSSHLAPPTFDERRTNVRFHILAAATAASFIMYLHRAFIAEILKYDSVKAELNLTPEQVAYTYSAFFFSYALCQVPMGWVADAFGRRLAFAVYVIVWSIFTALGGLATGFLMMFVVRLMVGLAQAGAIRRQEAWYRVGCRSRSEGERGGLIAAGGRFGGVVFAVLTTYLLKKCGMSWQSVMFLYGGIGVLIGIWYWIVARNDPRDHPWCNAAEIEYIEHGRPPEKVDTAPVRVPFVELLTSPVMWYMAVAQFGTNIGWAVVITTFPAYLKEATSVDDTTGGWLVTSVWMCGFVGTLLGGRLVDYTTHRYGLRWGRIGPTIVTRFAAAGCYIAALMTKDPYIVTAAFAAANFFSDLGLPGIWAFAQDVGGRNVGAVLGWGNMFGNLGAAAASVVYLRADELFRGVDGPTTNHDGTVIAAMIGFVISGIAAFGINAAKPIGAKTAETPAV